MDASGESRQFQSRRLTGSNWTRAVLGLAALLASFAAAQQSGSLAGRLTDLHSHPIPGATVVLRNARTGAESRTLTSKDGAYRFESLPPGEYSLEAVSAELGSGQMSGIVITASHRAQVQTALSLGAHAEPLLDSARVRFMQSPANAAVRFYPAPGQLPSAPQQMASALPHPTAIAPGATLPGTAAGVQAPVTKAPVREAAIPAAPASLAPVGVAEPVVSAVAAELSIRLPGIMLAGVGAARLQAALQSMAQVLPVAEAAELKTDPLQPATTTTIAAEQLQSLPLSGRHWQDFTPDKPPTQPDQETAGGIAAGPATTRESAAVWLAFGGRAAGRAAASALTGAGAGESAIREMRVADAADGVPDERGGLRTMSGADLRAGRGPHGQLFLFDRQNMWGAQNPFTQWVKETAPATPGTVATFAPFAWSPGDRRLTAGAGFGGVLRRNRLFWFGAADADLRNDPAVSSVRHPYLCANPPQCTEQTGFFAQPSNDEMQVLSARLRLSPASPVSEGLAAYSQMMESLDSLLGPAPRTSTQWTGFARIDWNAAERHRFTLQGSGATFNSPGGGMGRASEMYGTHSLGSSRAGETWALARWEAFITANLLAVTQVSMGRELQVLAPETPSPFEQTLNANQWRQLPQMVVDSRYGFSIGNPARFGAGSYPDEHFFQAQENVDWVHGSLLVRAGFDLRHNGDATSLLCNHFGTYHYSRVENFASDALVFAKYGLAAALDPLNQHNCDERGKAWRDATGQLHGLGYLPCYSYYTQTIGPADWHLETNDWAGFGTAQWQPAKRLVISAGLRWEHQDMPPPIALVRNPELPLTERLPGLGSQWAPRFSLAWGGGESHLPTLRLGYGMYYGRTSNAVLETALTQTGSLKGDVNLFMRPTDNLPGGAGGAPPFPYVLAGDPGTIEKPGAVEMAPGFRNAEVHQGLASLEEMLPGRILVSVSAMVSLARRLPISVDTNFDPEVNPGAITYSVIDPSGKGPIRTPRITLPFYAAWPGADAGGRLNPDYQQISEIFSRANSTYEAGVIRISRSARRGLSFHLRYAYAHAMDWNPNESAQVAGASVFDPGDFRQEYGTSNLDIRHSASIYAIWESPWKLNGEWGRLWNGWMLSGIGQFHSGLPYTMRTAGSVPEEFTPAGAVIAGLGPGMNGYGGDDRVFGVGRNTFRYPATWKADVRMAKRFPLGHEREFELMAESFNLFNHQNVTELETVGYYIQSGTVAGSFPTLNFLTGLKAGQTEFGQPLNINATDSYRERQFDFGIRLRFKREPEIE